MRPYSGSLRLSWAPLWLPTHIGLWLSVVPGWTVSRSAISLSGDLIPPTAITSCIAVTPTSTHGISSEELRKILRSQDLSRERLDRILPIEKKLKKLKIYVTHLERVRHHTVMSLGNKDCFNTTFERDGKKVNLVDFFKMEYKIRLNYPNLPPVNVSQMQRPTYYPMELCFIGEDQPYLGDISKDQQTGSGIERF